MKYLYNSQHVYLHNLMKRALDNVDVTNIFNPSFYLGTSKVLAFRAIPRGSKALTSYVYIESTTGAKVYNISQEFGAHAPRLIDPKIFVLNNKVYITLHSGWVPSGNDIYVLQIEPRMKLFKIQYANRCKQERNWAFYIQNNEVFALYSIDPLRILKRVKVSNNEWIFDEWFGSGHFDNKLSIGTQLTSYKDGYLFMAHEKKTCCTLKSYVGRLGYYNPSVPKIVLGAKYTHSLLSRLGAFPKHNTHLWSCTYFSGIQIIDGKVVVGYGINDLHYGFAHVETKSYYDDEDI